MYPEGTVDTAIRGTAILWEDAGDTLRVPSATYPLPVSVVAGSGSGTSYVDDAAYTVATDRTNPIGGYYNSSLDTLNSGDVGTVHVTQYRGMHVNLRDSSGNELTQLALNAGAAGATVLRTVTATDSPDVTSLAIIDDWDESDRAKVNLIVGQAGVAAGAGATGATVVRVQPAIGDTCLLHETTDTWTDNQSAGVAMLGAIRDTPSSIYSDGAIGAVALTRAGKVHVTDLDSQVYFGAIQTSVQLIDDSVATLGTTTYTEATTKAITIGALRRDADTSAVNTTNEIAPLIVDANGYLKVEIFDGGGSHTVDNAGTFAVQVDGAALTALQLIDDVVYADDADWTDDTSKHALVGGVRMDTPHTVTDGDTGPVRIDANSNLMVVGNVAHDGVDAGNPVKIGGFASSSKPTNVSNSDRVNAWFSAFGSLHVSLTGSAGDQLSDSTYLRIGGSEAHDAADSGNPVKIGAKAVAHGSSPTAVAAADRTDLYANRHGVLFTIGGHPNVITRSVIITDATGAQTDASIAGTIAAGTKLVVTRITAIADADNTGDINVKVGFGASVIPADSATGAAAVLFHHPGMPAGGGATVGDGSGILGIGADGEELRLTCDDPAGGSVTITFSYYEVPS